MKIFVKQALTAMMLLILSFSSLSAQVSQQQIEQFKKLPAAQQQALASNMGVDINAIKGQLSSSPANTPAPVTPVIARAVSKNAPIITQMAKPQTLKPFGYEVFANAPSTFSPLSDIAIPASYIIGTGDRISIQIFGKENLSLELDVNREGDIVLPSHGPFSVASLSFNEMKKFLTAKLKAKIIGVDVVIGLASLRSMRVFVLGDAYKPGPYTLSSLSSITHALFAAGGISNIGSLRKIQLKRAGKLITTLDLYDLLIDGDSTNDLMLQSGDVVFIPPVEKIVSVSGLVRRPAIYELDEGDTFKKVLTMAGGALPSAYLKYTQVKRYSDNSYRQVINLDLSNASDLNNTVNSGDAIVIKQTNYIRTPKIPAVTHAITLTGAVTKAGNYQWFKGQKIADVLPEIETYVSSTADLQYAIVVREINKAREIDVIQFSLSKALSDINSPDNVLLQATDNIIIFTHTLASRVNLLSPIIEQLKRQSAAGQPLQLVDIDGEIKFPGTYPLVNNARVSKLISAAGGYLESAYLSRAELTRNKIEGITLKKTSKNIDLSAIIKGDSSANVLLKSKDRLNIHKIPAWSENLTVELKGEFVFPGRYTIRRGEKLSSLIAKAGGFTEFAHQEASVLTRVKLRARESQNIAKLSNDLKIEMASKSLSNNNAGKSSAEINALLADIAKVVPIGRLVLNLPRVVEKNDYDVLLEGGDALYVPALKNSVNVIGQVQVPTSHIFDAMLTADDYLEKSGGSKQRADRNRIYIISANGSIKMMASANWFSNPSENMKPGDTLVVPLDTEYTDNLTLWSSVTTILYNSAVAFAAINGINGV